jgi:alpha-N-arabinofuranosidase
MDRNGPKYFVGEYATRVGTPNNNTATNNMDGALGDAAWIVGFERNSDLVMMASYAPLFVNVNPGGQQWAIDLIGYDALNSYGSPSYYVQKIFSTNHGDAIVPVTGTDTPTITRTRDGLVQQGAPLFYSATRDTKTGTIYLKVVNTGDAPLPVHIEIKGVTSVSPEGELTTLAASAVSDTNSITDRTKLVPVTTKVNGLSMGFTRTFPPFSVSALQIQAK